MADLPKRDTHRWQGYDYANVGAYYLTICTDDRRHWFGHIVDGVMHRSPIGELAQRCWDAIPEHMPHVDVGEFVVMPNHVHGIVVIRERLVDARGRSMDGVSGGNDVGADHDRPDPPTRPDTMANDGTVPPDASPDHGTAMDNETNGGDLADAPAAQMRADHDRPLRPPADPGAPPKRPMPIVPVGSLGRIVRAYKPACRQAGPRLRAWRTAMGCCPTARPYGNAIIGTA
jgi:hypothetical protein